MLAIWGIQFCESVSQRWKPAAF